MIEGCLDWQRNGLVRPDVVIASTNEYFSEQDLMSQWLEERCDVDRQNNHKWEQSADLFADWKTYARAAGEEAGNTKTFGEAMRKKGFVQKRHDQGSRLRRHPSFNRGEQKQR